MSAYSVYLETALRDANPTSGYLCIPRGSRRFDVEDLSGVDFAATYLADVSSAVFSPFVLGPTYRRKTPLFQLSTFFWEGTPRFIAVPLHDGDHSHFESEYALGAAAEMIVANVLKSKKSDIDICGSARMPPQHLAIQAAVRRTKPVDFSRTEPAEAIRLSSLQERMREVRPTTGFWITLLPLGGRAEMTPWKIADSRWLDGIIDEGFDPVGNLGPTYWRFDDTYYYSVVQWYHDFCLIISDHRNSTA
jgi:hypothetical protein